MRSLSIPFIRWAAARHLTAAMTIDHPPSQFPGVFQDEDVHQAELHQCLNDVSLPLEVRITGALVRLYALPLTRIVELTEDQFHTADDGHAYLTISRHPVLLPPKLARLVDTQLRAPTALRQPPDKAKFLLPGLATSHASEFRLANTTGWSVLQTMYCTSRPIWTLSAPLPNSTGTTYSRLFKCVHSRRIPAVASPTAPAPMYPGSAREGSLRTS